MYERETESKRVLCISATWVLVAELPSWDFYAVCAPLKNNTNPQSHPLIYLFIVVLLPWWLLWLLYMMSNLKHHKQRVEIPLGEPSSMQCCDHGAPAPITMLQSPSEYGMVAPPTKGSYVTVEVQLHWGAPDFYFFPFFPSTCLCFFQHSPINAKLYSLLNSHCPGQFLFSRILLSPCISFFWLSSLLWKWKYEQKERKKKSIYHVNTKRFFFLFCVNKSEKKFDKNAFHNSLGPASKLLLKMVFLLWNRFFFFFYFLE